ncbi:RNA 2',3'-cyclic phosphodiesterase [Clostridium sp. MB40-C1]|uniref:RNA 2',3'-cyclic phosphodiesterase n=1 Tax=Clostridium sp. MB40-C1 TaxID=3070996 RepID=UPI0027E0DF16|nr:RNA 2',3'-cyclic phosphodiesterase [Clostridium sp. MB40-C1]WMJ82042.1 RNA 2',3'-cyclic phosphodiesterase [Clostridium sp. MB40-C1]
MRVFYAVTFDEKIKEKFSECRDIVSKHSIKGTFTNTNNFHLTLEFIGQVDEKQLRLLINVLQKLKNLPKELDVSNIGSFKRGNKEIIWCGIEENKELMKLQEQLRNLLIKNGFSIDNRKYKPHITIGRQIVRVDSTKELIVEPMQAPIRSIALMESKKINNQLIYEVLREIIV